MRIRIEDFKVDRDEISFTYFHPDEHELAVQLRAAIWEEVGKLPRAEWTRANLLRATTLAFDRVCGGAPSG